MRDFIEIYTKNAPLLHAHKVETWPDEHSIAAAFSVDRLDDQSKRVLWALTFFDPDHIPSELLMLAFDGGASFITMKNKFEYTSKSSYLKVTRLMKLDTSPLWVSFRKLPCSAKIRRISRFIVWYKLWSLIR